MAKNLFFSLFWISVAIAFPSAEPPPSQFPPSATTPSESKVGLAEAYGRLALGFEPNQGQAVPQVKFLSRGGAYSLLLTSTGAVLRPNWIRDDESEVRRSAGQGSRRAAGPAAGSNPELHLQFVGSNPSSHIAGLDMLQGKTNYFIGNDPKKWRTGVPSYGRVQYKDIYPGIDLVYYANVRQLEYDIAVAPGADPRRLRLRLSGGDRMELSGGDVVVEIAGREIRMKQPTVYQPTASGRRRVDGHYVKMGKNEVGFQLASYDAGLPLVLDPLLAYSTYLGGTGFDTGKGIAVDSSGNAYLTGQTNSLDFPAVPQFEGAFGGSNNVFVSKVNSSGTALVYSTIIGGVGTQGGNAIAVDATGNAYVTGITNSIEFPIVGGFQAKPSVSTNSNGTTSAFNQAFVLKLSPDGATIAYSTYLGGSGNDFGRGIALDSSGNAFVTGNAVSFNFPTKSPIQGTKGDLNPSIADAFVAKINAAGSALVYSTYLGGAADDQGAAIAVDGAGSAYVTGETISPNFPTVNALQGSRGGNPNAAFYDAFVAKINAAGTALTYSTYVGGSSTDMGNGIAVDGIGNAYVAGFTISRDFPVAPPQSVAGTAFVAKLSGDGSTLVYSRNFGGDGTDMANAVAVDGAGEAVVAGSTTSTNFPSIAAPEPLAGLIPPTGFFGQIAFVTEVNAGGTALVYSTALGGGADSASAIAVDTAGSAYVTGQTSSFNFPTVNPIQLNLGGGLDAFVAKLGVGAESPPLILTNGVVNGASFRLATDPNGAVAPGAIVSIFGQNLAPGSRVATSLPLPTSLFGISVMFNGVAAPLFYVSSTQINVQVPYETPTGLVTVEVQRDDQTTATLGVTVAPVSPGIFTLLQGGVLVGAILHAKTFGLVTDLDPAVPGEYLAIYATGLGALTQPVPDGDVPPSPPPETVFMPTVTIGGKPAPVVYSGPAAKYAGLNQINVQVPSGLGGVFVGGLSVTGGATLALTINGVPSNVVTLIVQ